MAGDDLHRLSAGAAARLIAAGSLTAEALVGACLTRIAEREGDVGAWAHLYPEQALDEARARDREPLRGPLHGVPIGVKDIMDTADRPTGYGSRAYAGHRPMGDAACVALARAAGAVVLGKTVTTEFAMMAPGKTRNPHDPTRTPGGSSSGSAAAVADFMVPLAFGTQTAGSILRPASYCGVVGYKPSWGLVAIAGTKPLALSLDTVGGLARSVGDVALLIGAITGRPELVPGRTPATEPAVAPRIGVFRPVPFDQAEPATITALDHAAAAFARAGAVVAERAAFPEFDRLVAAQEAILGYESAANLAWERTARAALLAPATLRLLEAGTRVSAAQYDAALQEVAAARARTAAFFGAFDAMLVPAAPGEAPDAASTGDPIFNRAWTALHLPCITIPAGRGPAGLPVGVQLVGRAREDWRLLAVAQFAEEALRAASLGGNA
ncbi:MAG TPA: amidase [Stellaceae bacterium]|nr:amidase [Stellaceae bacterium]